METAIFFGENRILKNEVAVKFYYWGGDAKYHAEPSTLAAIEAPNILQVKNAGLLDGEWAYFVTPRCPNGDLDDVLEKLSTAIFRPLSAPVKYCVV